MKGYILIPRKGKISSFDNAFHVWQAAKEDYENKLVLVNQVVENFQKLNRELRNPDLEPMQQLIIKANLVRLGKEYDQLNEKMNNAAKEFNKAEIEYRKLERVKILAEKAIAIANERESAKDNLDEWEVDEDIPKITIGKEKAQQILIDLLRK